MSNIADLSSKLLAFWGNLTSGNVLTAAGVDRPPTFQPGGGGGVSSVFGRTGAVVAVDDDYRAAQLADEVDGSILTWSPAGEAVLIGPGAAGQILTSNGAGNAPSFQAAAAGGKLVSSRFATFSTHTVGITDIIPIDDTIPQRTEGFEIIAMPSFSPADVANILLVFAHMGVVSKTSAGVVASAIFTDQSLNAFGGSTVRVQVINSTFSLTCMGNVIAGIDTPIIISLRAGVSTGGGDFEFNGTSAAVWGAMPNQSFLAVLEIAP